jgi:DNA-binding winged helix-turn-helix (wHTH) protein
MVNLCLWRAEERMPLTPKAFDILRYLVERADRLVTHYELLEALWPETYVNPEGLRKYILEIRKVLGDRPKHSLFIQTLPKRGYQFVAKVADGRKQVPLGVEAGDSTKIAGRDTALVQFNNYLEKALSGQRQMIFATELPDDSLAERHLTRDRRHNWVAVAIYVAPLSSPFESYPDPPQGIWATINQGLSKAIGEGRYDKD